MSQPPAPEIRDIMLSEIHKAETERRQQRGQTLQQGPILHAVASELAKRRPGIPWQMLPEELQEAILTQWGELFRTGLIAWGFNLSNPNPPFFHLTERGQIALANATRDPSNPLGYLRHLESRTKVNPIARSYLVEALVTCLVFLSHA